MRYCILIIVFPFINFTRAEPELQCDYPHFILQPYTMAGGWSYYQLFQLPPQPVNENLGRLWSPYTVGNPLRSQYIPEFPWYGRQLRFLPWPRAFGIPSDMYDGGIQEFCTHGRISFHETVPASLRLDPNTMNCICVDDGWRNSMSCSPGENIRAHFQPPMLLQHYLDFCRGVCKCVEEGREREKNNRNFRDAALEPTFDNPTWMDADAKLNLHYDKQGPQRAWYSKKNHEYSVFRENLREASRQRSARKRLSPPQRPASTRKYGLDAPLCQAGHRRCSALGLSNQLSEGIGP